MRDVPRLHAITDDARLADARFVDDAAEVLEIGGSEVALHLRGRETTAARLFEIASALLPVARASGATLLVNDRVDVALVARADGVQLREDSLDAAAARALLGAEALIGVSRHAQTVAQVADATDFVLFGSVFETASHPGRTPTGIDALGEAASVSRRQAGGRAVPLVAIGGITPERVAEVMQAGAHGIAALSTIWQGGPNTVQAFLDALVQARARGPDA